MRHSLCTVYVLLSLQESHTQHTALVKQTSLHVDEPNKKRKELSEVQRTSLAIPSLINTLPRRQHESHSALWSNAASVCMREDE